MYLKRADLLAPDMKFDTGLCGDRRPQVNTHLRGRSTSTEKCVDSAHFRGVFRVKFLEKPNEERSLAIQKWRFNANHTVSAVALEDHCLTKLARGRLGANRSPLRASMTTFISVRRSLLPQPGIPRARLCAQDMEQRCRRCQRRNRSPMSGTS